MRKLALFALLLACIFAYPQKFNLIFDETDFNNIPLSSHDIGKKLNIPREKLSRALDLCQTTTALDEDLQNAMNACTDRLFEVIDGLLVETLDPLSLPDQHSGFNYTLIITYHGELDLTNGQLEGFSTLHRNGDVQVDIFSFNLTLPLAFDNLAFTYDYSAKIMNLGPSGGIEGNVKNLEMEIGLSYNIFNRVVTLDHFTITSSGHINFEFTGHALIDWLLNLLNDVVTALLKKVILNIMDTIIGGALEAAVDAINEILANSTIVNATPKINEEAYKKNVQFGPQ